MSRYNQETQTEIPVVKSYSSIETQTNISILDEAQWRKAAEIQKVIDVAIENRKSLELRYQKHDAEMDELLSEMWQRHMAMLELD